MSIQTSTDLTQDQANRKPLIRNIYVVAGVVVLLVLAGLIIWGVIWLAQSQREAIEAVRDIFIIALTLISCAFGIVLMMLLIMVIRLVNMLEFEIKPILEKTNETVGMVRGTTGFVSRNVVKPVTTASSYFAGIRRGFKALFGDPRKNLAD
jgi:cytochrome c biogenesis protein CcdA